MFLGLHASKKHFGIGLLFIFLGTLHFFQTILSGNVYNLYFDVFLFSSGSTLIFISTLFGVLLIFRNENVTNVRSAIYGIVLSNIILVFLSYISLEQILTDSYSRNTTFLAEIFNIDIHLFISGVVLLYLDMISIILIYRYIDSKYPKNYFLQFFGASVITAVVNSILFYSENFYSEVNYAELMIGNIAEKIMVCIIFSILWLIRKDKAKEKILKMFL